MGDYSLQGGGKMESKWGKGSEMSKHISSSKDPIYPFSATNWAASEGLS